MSTTKKRGRELGLPFAGTTGPYNAITDVPGVEVGYATITRGKDPSDSGPGVQTGVTALLPRGKTKTPQYVYAGMHALNGNGEMTGAHWVQDAGYFLGPVCITNTHSVGVVHHATVKWIVDQYSEAFGDRKSTRLNSSH